MNSTEHRRDYWLEWHLRNWRDWLMSGGYPQGAGGTMLNVGAEHADFDDMCQTLDRTLAATTDAVVHDLPPNEQCALHRAYLQAVYRFREPFATVLFRAKVRVAINLERKGVWLGG